MREASPTGRKSRRSWSYGKVSLVVAVALTISMVGWQGYHLASSYRAVANRDAGDCPTRAVEAAYGAGERLGYLADEIEHSLLLWGDDAAASPIVELGDRFEATDTELLLALDQAEGLAKKKVLAAILAMEMARVPLGGGVDDALGLVEDGRAGDAVASFQGPEYATARSQYDDALAGLWAASRQHLVRQLENERRGEVLSVGVAVVLFALALGAWAVFLQRIRRGQALLEDEERQRRLAEAELLQSQKMEALGLMAGGLAHDFNNLLTVVTGSAVSAREQLDDAHPAVPALERIGDAAVQADGMVSALLTFSRRAESAATPVDVGDVVESTGRIVRSMLPATIDFAVDCRDPGRLWVAGDATQLQQVIMNLTLNAQEAMPAGGELRIGCRQERSPQGEDQVVIEVVDTGEGMSPEVAAQIFTPFFTTRAPGQGTGLGLSIAHGIIIGHGGRITVDSAPGAGTTVSLTVPSIAVPEQPTDPESPPGVERLRGNGQVLLVEDHRHVREIIAESLETAGFRVAQAATGAEFAATYGELRESLRLVIADVDIPPPNGVECIRMVHADRPGVPAIAITGTPAPGLEDELAEQAIVLRKPFSMTELAALSARLIDRAPA